MKIKPLRIKFKETNVFFKEILRKEVIKDHLKMEALRRKMRREVGLS